MVFFRKEYHFSIRDILMKEGKNGKDKLRSDTRFLGKRDNTSNIFRKYQVILRKIEIEKGQEVLKIIPSVKF